MTVRFLLVCGALLTVAASNCAGQRSCNVAVRAQVEIADSDLTLADLLTPDSCAEVRTAAAAVNLGATPLEGSPRVLLGSQVKERIEAIISGNRDRISSVILSGVPERITVRRAGSRASCAEIRSKLFPRAASIGAESRAGELDCGANAVPRDAFLQQVGKAWDPAMRSWIITARCASAGECVPFAVRVPGEAIAGISRDTKKTAGPVSAANALVHPGQPATLLWDQDGIRIVIASVCLDAGAAGDTVRARIVRSHQILRAIVVSAGELKAGS